MTLYPEPAKFFPLRQMIELLPGAHLFGERWRADTPVLLVVTTKSEHVTPSMLFMVSAAYPAHPTATYQRIPARAGRAEDDREQGTVLLCVPKTVAQAATWHLTPMLTVVTQWYEPKPGRDDLARILPHLAQLWPHEPHLMAHSPIGFGTDVVSELEMVLHRWDRIAAAAAEHELDLDMLAEAVIALWDGGRDGTTPFDDLVDAAGGALH